MSKMMKAISPIKTGDGWHKPGEKFDAELAGNTKAQKKLIETGAAEYVTRPVEVKDDGKKGKSK